MGIQQNSWFLLSEKSNRCFVFGFHVPTNERMRHVERDLAAIVFAVNARVDHHREKRAGDIDFLAAEILPDRVFLCVSEERLQLTYAFVRELHSDGFFHFELERAAIF
jgi:hypothetical protein